MNTIYYIPLGENRKPDGIPVPVTLMPDGSVDLSGLPEELRQHLSDFGVPDTLHQGTVMPNEGEAFLTALLESSNGYQVFTDSI